MSQSLHNDSTSKDGADGVLWLCAFMINSYYCILLHISSKRFHIFHICPFLLAVQSHFSIIYLRVCSSNLILGQLSLSLSHHHPLQHRSIYIIVHYSALYTNPRVVAYSASYLQAAPQAKVGSSANPLATLKGSERHWLNEPYLERSVRRTKDDGCC